jgi:hypothetical protein
MSALHEVLAVDKDLENVCTKVVSEAVVDFKKKEALFSGHIRTLRMFDDSRKSEEAGQVDVKELTTTVPEKLEYVAGHLIRYYDALAQKEATNQLAKADVLLPDGTVLIAAAPATLLLGLENKLSKLRDMYDNIPTLQPGVEWKEDSQAGMRGVYRAVKDELGLKTEKDFNYRVLVQPTKEHPAQIEKWNIDKPVGEYSKVRTSGMLSPKEKSDLLGRLDILISSIKKARMRANTQEVQTLDVGKRIFKFLHEDLGSKKSPEVKKVFHPEEVSK